MRILSVNVSGPKELTYRGQTVATGIFKTPVAGRVRVSRLSIDGDVQVDKRVHGGVDKAVYAYPHEHYAHWEKFLGRTDFAFGQFGENLTTVGLLEDEVRVGDVWRVGTVALQVTQPREPCFKLMSKMNDFKFAKPFLASGRTGFYLRVLAEGEIGAGDSIERVTSEPAALTIREVIRQQFGV
ncbi:MAG: MOSC domain-containing protein [Verrucomicrobiota bacterium]